MDGSATPSGVDSEWPPLPPPKVNRYPIWSPRLWHGMRLGDFLLLLARHGFRVSPSRWPMVATACLTTTCNSLLARIQSLVYGRAIAAAKLRQPPVLVIGHLRTGTTHLYELLACDKRFSAPTSFDCFSASHFVLSGRWLPRLTSWIMPRRRPMDDMAMGLDRPQEDEFALVSLGAPTLYERLAFPNEPPAYLATVDLAGMPPAELDRLTAALRYFYSALNFAKPGRLLLKSPVHTGRLPLARNLLPGVKLVHIVRDPREVFASLRNAWRALDLTQGFQDSRPDVDYDELILSVFERSYASFAREVDALPLGTLCEVRYERLVENPLGELERIYGELSLGDFAAVRPDVQAYLAKLTDYRVNAFSLDAPTTLKIAERWRWYCERYGYELSTKG